MTSSIRMTVLDLDGTLAGPGGVVDARELATLEALGRLGVLRVVATGRNWKGALKLLSPEFPIDYLVFSSGAGIVDWRTKDLLLSHHLGSEQIRQLTMELVRRRMDFMIHHPVPDNHYFRYHHSGKDNPDFHRRCERHAEFARPWDPRAPLTQASQCLVIFSGGGQTGVLAYEELRSALPTFNVIRATSPLDGESLWVEIFTKQVAKSLASQWLASRHGISSAEVLAVGNDYNDIDLLAWAGHPFVVENSPEILRRQYRVVASNERHGVSEAISIRVPGVRK